MKVNENLSILFYLNTPKKSKDGLVSIYVRITVDGKKDEFSSGKKIDPGYWDAKIGAGKDCPDQNAINSYITKTKSGVEKCYILLEASHANVSAAMVKESYLPKTVVIKTLLNAFQLHNREFAEKVS